MDSRIDELEHRLAAVSAELRDMKRAGRARALVRRAAAGRWAKRCAWALVLGVPAVAIPATYELPIPEFADGDLITAASFNSIFESVYAGLNTLDAGVVAVDARVDAVDARVDNADAGITGLDTRLTAAEGAATTLTGRVDALDTSAGDLGTRLSSAEGDISTLQATDATHATALTDLDGRVDTLESDPTITGVLTVQGDVDAQADVLVGGIVRLAPDARVAPDGFVVTNPADTWSGTGRVVHTLMRSAAVHNSADLDCAGIGARICSPGQYKEIGMAALQGTNDCATPSDAVELWTDDADLDACPSQASFFSRTAGGYLRPCPTATAVWTVMGYETCGNANSVTREYACCYGG